MDVDEDLEKLLAGHVCIPQAHVQKGHDFPYVLALKHLSVQMSLRVKEKCILANWAALLVGSLILVGSVITTRGGGGSKGVKIQSGSLLVSTRSCHVKHVETVTL